MTERDLDSLWTDLADDENTKSAFRAMQTLAASSKQAVPYIRKRVSPATAEDQKRIDQFIADLASGDFAKRKKAQAELTKMAVAARPAIQRALEKKTSLDVAERLQALLQAVDEGRFSANELRMGRILAALEGAHAQEATDLLKEWANGAPGAWLTEEAKASLKRMEGAR
jgi:hypothetical protein